MFEFSELPAPLIRHLNGLWRRRWLVVAVAWATAALCWLAIWLIPDRYESRAHVYVQTETILEPVLNGFTARPDYSRRVEVMRLQLLTRPNLEEVVRRAHLDRFVRARGGVERRAEIAALVKDLGEAITIESPRDMYFVITYRHWDPEAARAVVDAVMSMLIEQDLGASLSEDEAARRRLDLQIEEYEEKLTANERAVAAFRSLHANELASTQGTTRRQEQKETELASVVSEIERTKGRILTIQNLLSATPRAATGGELERLKVELADLRSKYQDDHPDIRGVLARIAQLESGAAAGLSANPEYVRLQSELRVAQDSVSALSDRETRLRDELLTLDIAAGAAPAVAAELQQIVREYEQTQKTYDELLSRRDRLELTRNLGAAGRGVEYQIFERPETALLPSDPPRMLLIFAGLVVALGAGLGAAFVMTLIDRSFMQAGELREAFGLPVLGAISETASAANQRAHRRDVIRIAAASASLIVVCGAYVIVSTAQLPDEAPRAAYDDAAQERGLRL